MSALDYWLFNSAISASLVLIVGAVVSLLFRQPAHQQRLGELAVVGATEALLLTAIPGVAKIFLRWLPAQAITKPTVTRSPFHIGVPPQRRYRRQARAGLAFLRGQMDQLGHARLSKGTWSGKPSVFMAWPGPQWLLPIHHNGATTTDQIAAGLWMSANQLDLTERSGNMSLTHYGEITYSQLKSMIYAGLSPRDPRVIRLSRWIAAHYTLSHNPAENGSLGVYYYYVTFAKTLRATGRAWIVGSTGVRHNWRRDLVYALAHRIDVNGSWVNHGSKAWLEGNPVMATTYAVLALDQVVR